MTMENFPTAGAGQPHEIHGSAPAAAPAESAAEKSAAEGFANEGPAIEGAAIKGPSIEGSAAEGPATDVRLRRAAQTVSWLLHPFAVPLYVLAVMLFADSYLSHLTGEVKTYLVWVVVLYAAVIPALSIGFLRTLGFLDDLSISTRRSRLLPLAIGIVCYMLCAITVSRLASAGAVRQFVLAAACCEAFALAVTPFWKVSLHLTAMGGVTAMFYLLNIAGMGHLFWALIASVLCSGLLASARLQLGAHTPLQVAVGFVGGFAVSTLAILYL